MLSVLPMSPENERVSSLDMFTKAFGAPGRRLSAAYCHCCGGRHPVLKLSPGFLGVGPDPRNNLVCAGCLAPARQRALASAARAAGGRDFLRDLSAGKFRVYDAGCPPLFRAPEIWGAAGYSFTYFGRPPAGAARAWPPARRGNLEKLPFRDNYFDLVLTADVLEHVRDLGRALGEIARVLKPGGLHFFTVPYNPLAAATVEYAPGRGPLHLASPPTRKIRAARDFGSDVLARLSHPAFTLTAARRRAGAGAVTVFRGKKALTRTRSCRTTGKRRPRP